MVAVITLLLQHDPSDRPTALELSQSPLLPPRLEDEYFKGALRMMSTFPPVEMFTRHQLISIQRQQNTTLLIDKRFYRLYLANLPTKFAAFYMMQKPSCLNMLRSTILYKTVSHRSFGFTVLFIWSLRF